MSSIELSNLSKSFVHNGVKKLVLDNLNLKVNEGEFIVILGGSGAGKSTLLRIINGLEKQDSGCISFDDKVIDDLFPGDRNIGMVFQSYALYPHLTVFENIAFGVRYSDKMSSIEISKKVEAIAATLELDDILKHYPKQLSGGQQQRVAIGRALVMQPQLLLFDEPLSNLDISLRTKLRHKIAEYQRLNQMTTIYVTHDQQEAMILADKIVVMNKGKVEQIGTPQELYQQPNSQFVAGFLGSPTMNFIPVELKRDEEAGLVVKIVDTEFLVEQGTYDSVATSANEAIVLGIRPEHVLVEQSGSFQGIVESIDYLGAESVASIKLEQSNLLVQAKLGHQQSLLVGEMASFNFSSKHLHFFDEKGKSLLITE